MSSPPYHSVYQSLAFVFVPLEETTEGYACSVLIEAEKINTESLITLNRRCHHEKIASRLI